MLNAVTKALAAEGGEFTSPKYFPLREQPRDKWKVSGNVKLQLGQTSLEEQRGMLMKWAEPNSNDLFSTVSGTLQALKLFVVPR